MRRAIFLLLIFIMVSIALLGLIEDMKITSNANGITFSLNQHQLSKENPILEIEIENSNQFEATYGSEWKIERYASGNWKTVFPIGIASFTTILHVVQPYQSNIETVDLRSYLKEDQLIHGKYRISKKMEVEHATQRIGVTFEIK